MNIAIEVGPSDTLTRISGSSVENKQFESSLKMNENSLESFNKIASRVTSTDASFSGGLSSSAGALRMPWRWRRSKSEPKNSSLPSNQTQLRGIMSYDHLLPLVRSAVLGVLSIKSDSVVRDGISFLALGLDSLGALALKNSVAKLSGCKDISSSAIFDNPTVQSLTEYLLRQSSDSEMLVAAKNIIRKEIAEYDPVTKDSNCDFDTLHMQRNMLYHTVASPHLKSFIETFHWTLESPADSDHLFEAWCDTVAEHDSLRLSFDPFAVPTPTQRIWKFSALDHLKGPAATSEWFKVFDFAVSDANQYDDCIRSCIQSQRELLFDVEVPSMYALFILNFTGTYCGCRQVLLLSIHHLLVDGISVAHILRSLDKHYSERLCNSSDVQRVVPNTSYRYAVLKELETPNRSMDEAKKYWSTILSGYSFNPSILNRPLPVIDAIDGEVVRYKTVLRNLHPSLVQACKQMEVTVAALYNALWSITFSLFVDADAVVYGNISSGRSQPWLDDVNIEHIVGPMIKTFPVAAKLGSTMSLSHIVKSMHKQLYESTANEFVPLSEIQRLVGASRSLFHLIFDFQPEIWNYSSSDKGGLVLSRGFLIDRIGCPLSMRVLVDGEDTQLHATSECKSYDLEFLRLLCTAYEDILTGFTRISERGDSYDLLLDDFLTQSSPHWRLRKESTSEVQSIINIEFSAQTQFKSSLDSHRLMDKLFLDLSGNEIGPTSMSAVISVNESGDTVSISYVSLRRMSSCIAANLIPHVLKHKRVGEDCVIAVVMEKGWEQVAAVLAVHQVQCAYLPMDARLWPEQRVKQVLRLSGAIAVVTQASLLASSSFNWLGHLEDEEHIPVVSVQSEPPNDEVENGAGDDEDQLIQSIPRSEPRDLAYLIYTSGSTGVPKGVCCHHLGASNTVDDINDLLCVGPEDRVLALSSLSFDLSVYDIFGPLSRGGAVVIPHPGSVSPPDPAEWLELLATQHVTIWNTVPAFMELLVSHLEFVQLQMPSSLRAVMLSGDWIPLNLPSRIWRCCAEPEKLRIISLGGATEASIWSNMFELPYSNGTGETASSPDVALAVTPSSSGIVGIPTGWASIPYGYPLRNQSMLILNERMEHCEVWVTGMIYIGGAGVARGYHKDPDRSALSFVRHPVTGETLFRTGDLGRVRPGGILEILGREDSQVKLNGYRIELGEIEKVLADHPFVSSATVAVYNQTLCAYFVPKTPSFESLHDTAEKKIPGTGDNESLVSDLAKHCLSQLTDYMVPRHFIELDSIPLSSNGKVVRSLLPSPRAITSSDSLGHSSSVVVPSNGTELIVRNLFSILLGAAEKDICCEKTTFFEMGGNSLLSIQLLFRIREQLKVNIGIQDLFAAATVCKLSKVIVSRPRDSTTSSSKKNRISVLQIQMGATGIVPIYLVNPAGASGLW